MVEIRLSVWDEAMERNFEDKTSHRELTLGTPGKPLKLPLDTMSCPVRRSPPPWNIGTLRWNAPRLDALSTLELERPNLGTGWAGLHLPHSHTQISLLSGCFVCLLGFLHRDTSPVRK